MSFAHSPWRSTGSTERPITLTPRRSNSGLIFAMYPSSVVQTGVKSFGCEKSTAHESPIQSWKSISPSVVCDVKSGAVSPIFSAIFSSSRTAVTIPGPRCLALGARAAAAGDRGEGARRRHAEGQLENARPLHPQVDHAVGGGTEAGA